MPVPAGVAAAAAAFANPTLLRVHNETQQLLKQTSQELGLFPPKDDPVAGTSLEMMNAHKLGMLNVAVVQSSVLEKIAMMKDLVMEYRNGCTTDKSVLQLIKRYQKSLKVRAGTGIFLSFFFFLENLSEIYCCWCGFWVHLKTFSFLVQDHAIANGNITRLKKVLEQSLEILKQNPAQALMQTFSSVAQDLE